MRISDWSSDVCSSDLVGRLSPVSARRFVPRSRAKTPTPVFARPRRPPRARILAVEAATCAVAAHRQPGRVVMDDEIIRAANAKKGSPFLDTAQAAHYVGLSRRTLEKMRVAGGGPKFRKHGRYVRYHIDDLDDWSSARAK